MRIGPAEPAEYIPALQMLFAHLPAADAQQRASAALNLLESKTESPAHLLVARRNSTILGAALMQVLVGATGVIWPPRADEAAIEDALTRQSLDWLKANGAKLAQAILAANEAFVAQPLLRNGFRHPTRLCYLSHDLTAMEKPAGEFEPCAEANRADFEVALWRSYEQTLDFPEVTGHRSLEEVIRGHRSSAGLLRWWLLRHGDQAAGVLLLEELQGGHALDLVYLGIVPEARRRGLGTELTRKALDEAKKGGAGELTLCVDARNAPARRVYDRLGFVEYDRREVFLAQLGFPER